MEIQGVSVHQCGMYSVQTSQAKKFSSNCYPPFSTSKIQQNNFILCEMALSRSRGYFGKGFSIKVGLVKPHFKYLVALKMSVPKKLLIVYLYEQGYNKTLKFQVSTKDFSATIRL